MKAIFSQGALFDLDQILEFTATHYPSLEAKLEKRIREAVKRIEAMPENARTLDGSDDIRVVPLVRYPFKIFYQLEPDRILILHIHHTARDRLT